LDKAKYKG